MVTQATAAEIWECYREIEAAEKLLADLDAAAKQQEGQYDRRDKFEPKLSDAFGRLARLQLGVPSGDNSHRLYGVSAGLAVSVIKAHIANKRAELVEANEKARTELNG